MTKKISQIVSHDKTTWAILPPAPDACQECAAKHPPEYPHNLQSMYYWIKFEQENGREPTVDDASAHCSDAWKRYLPKKIEFMKAAMRKDPFPEELVAELVELEREVFGYDTTAETQPLA